MGWLNPRVWCFENVVIMSDISWVERRRSYILLLKHSGLLMNSTESMLQK